MLDQKAVGTKKKTNSIAINFSQLTNNSVSLIIMCHIVGISQKHSKLAIKYRLLFKVAYDILRGDISA